ncbi:hypothetical protein ZHAS_00002731 [Anopheles sinensis]|uniref:Uncharacterized protein n=1 Tax=Anopheles sinensis TaxID=74873 RepID=A0A084VCW3_ANOSI|nr:hypothetical protein ZHAS_00002731 [Anopheles sinensis]
MAFVFSSTGGGQSYPPVKSGTLILRSLDQRNEPCLMATLTVPKAQVAGDTGFDIAVQLNPKARTRMTENSAVCENLGKPTEPCI